MTTRPWCLQSAQRRVVAWHTMRNPHYCSAILNIAPTTCIMQTLYCSWVKKMLHYFSILPAVARISTKLFHAGETIRVAILELIGHCSFKFEGSKSNSKFIDAVFKDHEIPGSLFIYKPVVSFSNVIGENQTGLRDLYAYTL